MCLCHFDVQNTSNPRTHLISEQMECAYEHYYMYCRTICWAIAPMAQTRIPANRKKKVYIENMRTRQLGKNVRSEKEALRTTTYIYMDVLDTHTHTRCTN